MVHKKESKTIRKEIRFSEEQDNFLRLFDNLSNNKNLSDTIVCLAFYGVVWLLDMDKNLNTPEKSLYNMKEAICDIRDDMMRVFEENKSKEE